MDTWEILCLVLVVCFLLVSCTCVDLRRKIDDMRVKTIRSENELSHIKEEVSRMRLASQSVRNVMQDELRGMRVDLNRIQENVLELQEPAKENAAAEARVLQGLENLLDYNVDAARKAVTGGV